MDASARSTTGRCETIEVHLSGLMDRIARATSLREVCGHALACLQGYLGVDRSAVLLLDGRQRMCFVDWVGLSESYRTAVEGHSPWSEEDPTPAPVLVPDVAQDASLVELRETFSRERIRALAFIPLLFGERLLGKFMLYYAEPHCFSTEEVAFARLVAGHIAFAVEHEQRLVAEDEARRQSQFEVERGRWLERHKELLIRAGQALSESLDEEQTYRALSALTVPEFADWYVVHRVDEHDAMVPHHIAHSDTNKVDLAWQVTRRWPAGSRSDSAVAVAVRTQRAQLLERIEPEQLRERSQDPEHHRLLVDLGLRSAIVAPLITRGETIGAMSFILAESGRNYDSEDAVVAEALASRAAAALQHARLYRQAESARKSAEEHASRLSVLSRASISVAPVLDPDSALTQLAKFIVSTLADYCVAYRVDSGGIRRVALAHADPAEQSLVESLVEAGPPNIDDEYGAGTVMRTGEPLFAEDVPAEMLEAAAQNATHLRVLRRLGPRSSLIVPLKARERILGALALATTDRSGRRYTRADFALAQELAARTALLIDNARLYSDALSATRVRDQILAVVSHDLRGPLNNVLMASELLLSDEQDQHRAKLQTAIRHAARHMNRLIQSMLDVASIEAGGLSLQRRVVNVGSLIRDVVALHSMTAEERKLDVRCDLSPEPIRAEVDPDRLKQALSNVIGNALKFTPEGGCVQVTAERADGRVQIGVEDTGPGVAPDHLPYIFDRFWRANGEDSRGVGLGLAIAKGIVEAHGGAIRVENRAPNGARFTLAVPVDA